MIKFETGRPQSVTKFCYSSLPFKSFTFAIPTLPLVEMRNYVVYDRTRGKRAFSRLARQETETSKHRQKGIESSTPSTVSNRKGSANSFCHPFRIHLSPPAGPSAIRTRPSA